MAKVKQVQPDPKINAQARDQAEHLAQELASSDFVKSLDLPDDLNKNSPTHDKLAIQTSEEAVEVGLRSDDEDDEQEENQPVTQGEEESEDEDLVPQSKVNKRIGKLQAEIRALKAENESKAEATPADADQVKLDKMSPAELKSLKRQVMAEWKKADDSQVEQKLLDLNEKIDETIMQGPQRFANKQVGAFNKASDDILDNNDISKSDFADIKQIAQAIYAKSNSMQKSTAGQAEALYLAFDHYTQISSTGRSGDKESRRQINQLKKKVSLDGKVHKGEMPQANLRKLRDRAKKTGDEFSKLDYFMKSGMGGDINAMVERQTKRR